MAVTLIVMTDGRQQYITKAIDSLYKLHGDINQKIIHDDSGDPEFTSWLKNNYPEFEVYSTGQKSGFAGAYHSAWNYLAEHAKNKWIFSTEDDFVFTRPVNLYQMQKVLRENPYIVQMALRRQPWNEEERTAGGIVESHPEDYTDKTNGMQSWLEHRRFFTTNPSLINISLIQRGWPNVEHSEGIFSIELFKTPWLTSAYWGTRNSGEWVEHIGIERTGNGY